MYAATRVTTGIVAAFLLGACTQKPPPAPERIDAAVSPLPPPNVATDGATVTSTERPDAGQAVANVADAGDPGALPQTHDKPAASGAGLDARSRALWDGIVADDPDLAMPFFFPVSAYAQVKDVASPASDWRHRLVSAYKRDIHGLHKRLGDKAANAKFVRLDVPEDRAKWVEPNEEWNKLGYWRVYGTHIVYDVDGKERTLDISSLISWRGEWYVVHLTGFK